MDTAKGRDFKIAFLACQIIGAGFDRVARWSFNIWQIWRSGFSVADINGYSQTTGWFKTLWMGIDSM